MTEDFEEYSGSFMMGALHTLSTPEEVPVERKRGPRVNMGFHPPARAWLPEPKRPRRKGAKHGRSK